MPQDMGASVSSILQMEREALEDSIDNVFAKVRHDLLLKPLTEVIPKAKPSWKERDVGNVILRLGQVGIVTTKQLDAALKGNINAKFKANGLKTFNADTLSELRAYFCQETPAMRRKAAAAAEAEDPVAAWGAAVARGAAAAAGAAGAAGGGRAPPPAAAVPAAGGGERLGGSAVGRWARGADVASPRAAARAASPAGGGAPEEVMIPPKAQAAATAAVEEEEEEEEDQEIPDYSTLLKNLDSAADTEALEEDARKRGIPVDRLENRWVVAALMDSLDSLNDATIQDLRKRCDHFRLAYLQSTSREDLRRLVKDGLIWDEMEVGALREECLRRGVPAPEASKKELVARLAGSTWEAEGVPVSRFASLGKAKEALQELKRQDELSSERLAKDGRQQWQLPAHLPLELLAEWMRKLAVWTHLPASELRAECVQMGLELKEPPEAAGGGAELEKAQHEFYRVQLLCALRRERCQAAGVTAERVGGSLADAEAVLHEFESLEHLDIAALRAEAQAYDVPELSVEAGSDGEREELLRLLKEVQIWSHMPLDSLRSECRDRDIVFPEVCMASAMGGVPRALFIAGTFTDFKPVDMGKVGKKFRCSLEVGEEGEESFQLILPDKSHINLADWDAVLYPSIADANPHVPHCVLGPNSAGHGRNWSIGTHDSDAEFSKPGAKCIVTVSFEEDAPVVSWGSESTISQILTKRPTAGDPRRTRGAPRQLKGGERRAPVEPAKKQAVRELARKEATLRALKAEGVSVSKLEGSVLKDLLEEFSSLSKAGKEALLHWYHKDVGLPIEEELDRKELLAITKRMAAWQVLPLEALKEEFEKFEHYPHSVIDENHKDGTPEQQRAYFVDKLLDQDRMEAWERRGYEARRIRRVDVVVDLICEYEQIKAMDRDKFRNLWIEADLPEEELLLPRDKNLASLKKLMVWATLTLPALQAYCRESGLPINVDGNKGQTDEQLRADLLGQLRVALCKGTLEAQGLPVERLGLLKTAGLVGDMRRYKAMDAKDLRDAYEGEQNFLPANTPRETILKYIQDVAIWEALPIDEFWKECEAHGIDKARFQLGDAVGPKEPIKKTASGKAKSKEELEEELRAELLDRLIFREHLLKSRRNVPSTAASPGLVDGGRVLRVLPPDVLRAYEEEEVGPGCSVEAVWRAMELMRDPFLAERICHCERKRPPGRDPLPAQARRWQPLQAALNILSSGKFDPDKHGVKAQPAVGAKGKPLLSVVCPTSDSRQHFHKLLYECYQTQDYEPKELIVVDSGNKESAFFKTIMDTDPSVVYRFFDVEDARDGQKPSKVAWSLGLKRNVGCCLARGAAIVHFDDDDLYAEGYLSWMQHGLAAASGDEQLLKPAAAKLTEWFLLDMTHRSFRFLDVRTDPNVPENERRGWLYGWGFSYIFTRSAWELAPFPDVEFAEDIGFLEGLMARDVPVRLMQLPPPAQKPGAGRLSAELPQGLVAHSFHAGSTSGGEFAGERRSGQLVGQPELLRHLMATVENITSLQKGPVGSTRFTSWNRPQHMLPGAGGKFQQPSFRIEKGKPVPTKSRPFPTVGFKAQLEASGAFR